MFNRELLELLLTVANVEIDIFDLAAFDGFVEFLPINIKGADFVLAVFDQTFGEICADESAGTKEKNFHERIGT